jgi:eukaryotic-like serine/threonine-protein kinase
MIAAPLSHSLLNLTRALMNEPAEPEEQIFAEALLVRADERSRYLDNACRGNAGLRERVEALLQAHESAGAFMAPPLAVSPGETARAPDLPVDHHGDKIGRYKLLQRLGEGGCGVVWMAEQEEPVRRRVALKVIKLGMDTKNVIARFEAERQALALMDHPNIARVLDAGATATGRPFFVMELVHGIPITKYCDQYNLPTPARLAIFTQVCHAVQHAHQKGVIHRDLKPSNVLVTLHDGEPVPKIIDFGIAKATQGRLTDHTLFTAFEQFIGTPAYMSPEQAEMSGIDIDTRSDIYSLGVLLYELLTGRPPFDPKSLVQAGLDEIRRIIREVEPLKPSTRLDTLADTDRSSIARHRGTAPAQLSMLLRGDLDWIVMKALEKNRTRRYETASGLAMDIQRHLQNEPVAARPPSTAYRIGRLIRRNRLAFGAALAVALTLIAGTIISTSQAVRATRAERLASRERAQAVEERAHAEDLLGFMLGDLRGQLAKVGRLDVLESVGDKAMAYFSEQEARGLDDPTLARHARALTQIGEIRMAQARYPEATAAFASAYDRTSALVARHPHDGDIIFDRGQAEYYNGLVRWKRGELSAAAEWMNRYNSTCQGLVALDPARPEWRSELAFGQHNLAALHEARGEFDPARKDFLAEQATLEKMAEANPRDADLQVRLADVHSWLGGIAEQQGEFGEASKQYAIEASQLDQLVSAEPGTAKWRFKLATTLLFQADVSLASGQYSAAAEKLTAARRLLDELVAQDSSNRQWWAAAQHLRLNEAMIARQRGDVTNAARLVGEVRSQIESFPETAQSDRVFILWLATAWRLETQLRIAAGRPDAAIAAARAVELGEKLIREGRARDTDVGECALACVLAGEIAATSGDQSSARHLWQKASDLLAPRLAGTHDHYLLDPAVRAATRLGHTDEARTMLAQLEATGYTPADPWPDASQSFPPSQSPK